LCESVGCILLLGPVCDADLASKHQFGDRSNMPGHSQGPVVSKCRHCWEAIKSV